MWVPIGFEQSFRMAYSRTRYGTGYYIYHQFVPGAPLSKPIRAWDAKTPPDQDVLDLLRAAGSDIAPAGTSTNGPLTIPKAGERRVVRLPALDAPGATIRALTFSAPKSSAIALGNVRLRITWEERGVPKSRHPPTSKGFGLELIEKTLPYELDAWTRVDWPEPGAKVEIHLPAEGKTTFWRPGDKTDTP